jgi:hypothetical protein
VKYDFHEDKKEDGTTYLLVPKNHQDQYGMLFDERLLIIDAPTSLFISQKDALYI